MTTSSEIVKKAENVNEYAIQSTTSARRISWEWILSASASCSFSHSRPTFFLSLLFALAHILSSLLSPFSSVFLSYWLGHPWQSLAPTERRWGEMACEARTSTLLDWSLEPFLRICRIIPSFLFYFSLFLSLPVAHVRLNFNFFHCSQPRRFSNQVDSNKP